MEPLFGAQAPADEKPMVRFGVVTDLHYADIPTSYSRSYRLSKGKLAEALGVFTARQEDFVIELGDFKDLGRDEKNRISKEITLKFARDIEAVFASGFKGPRYHVLGNHENDCLDKEDILPCYVNTGVPPGKSYYAFVRGGVRFLVLDGNFNSKMEPYRSRPLNWSWIDSNIPPQEIEWLRGELAASCEPVVVFLHQRLDSKARKDHRVKNGEAVQKILGGAGKVLGVFQGHDHVGGFSCEHGVNFYTLAAMVEGQKKNAFAEVAIYPSGKVAVTGFARAATRAWAAQTGTVK